MPSEPSATLTENTIDWQAVADELAGALRTTMLRNPTLTARDWARASAALERYEGATCGVEVEFRNPADV
ncbi:MAG TPA: hypothetical protein VFW57_06470 [Acidimicrobiia bacterium]|nr:hypothetical protein [Acidimicrobiia bacterium]